MAETTSIFADLKGYVERVAKLAQLDVALLSIETKNNLRYVGVSLALFVGALVTALLGVIILLFAIVLLLVQLGLSPSLSALIVAVALLVLSAILAFVGMGRVKQWSLTPRRTLAQFNSNLRAIQASLRNEANS